MIIIFREKREKMNKIENIIPIMKHGGGSCVGDLLLRRLMHLT